jgi:hypothetical protein
MGQVKDAPKEWCAAPGEGRGRQNDRLDSLTPHSHSALATHLIQCPMRPHRMSVMKGTGRSLSAFHE